MANVIGSKMKVEKPNLPDPRPDCVYKSDSLPPMIYIEFCCIKTMEVYWYPILADKVNDIQRLNQNYEIWRVLHG